MNKTELENAIKNGESVWACDDFLHRVIPYKANEIAITGINTKMPAYELKDLFATKQQAEHYLHHANITRTEHLPFLTWEEFKEGKELRFYNGKYRYKMNWSVAPEIIVIKRYLDFDIDEFIFNERLTEANFYRAYDECVRLFEEQ